METECLYCGSPITQNYSYHMKAFCSRPCYFRWFHRNAFDCNGMDKYNDLLSEAQITALYYYKQYFLPNDLLWRLIGVSRHVVSAFFNLHPLPYTKCMDCGEKIYDAPRNKVKKFCTKRCFDHYYNHKKQRYGKRRFVCFPDQVFLASKMRSIGFSRKDILRFTSINKDELEKICKFAPPIKRNCLNCKKEFITTYPKQIHCSEHCRIKFKQKKHKPRRLSMKTLLTKVVTPQVKILNANIWEPIILDGIPIYTATVLIPKNEEKFISAVNKAVNNAIIEGAKMHDGRNIGIKAKNDLPLKDGDLLDNPLFKDCYYINASTITKPTIYNKLVEPINDSSSILSGDIVRLSLTFKVYLNEKIKGIYCELGNFQKLYYQHEPPISEDTLFEEFTPYFLLVNDRKTTQE